MPRVCPAKCLRCCGCPVVVCAAELVRMVVMGGLRVGPGPPGLAGPGGAPARDRCRVACLDREAVSSRRQALVALCRGCLGWRVQDEGAVSHAGGDDLVAFQLTKTRAMVAVATPRSRASWRIGGRRAPWGSTRRTSGP